MNMMIEEAAVSLVQPLLQNASYFNLSYQDAADVSSYGI